MANVCLTVKMGQMLELDLDGRIALIHFVEKDGANAVRIRIDAPTEVEINHYKDSAFAREESPDAVL